MNEDFKQFILYTAPNGEVRVDVLLQNETVWLNQKAIAELFGVQRPAITKHLINIFDSGELEENSVSSILEHTADDGKNPSPKMNMKSIESFKIVCMKAILIGKLKRGMVKMEIGNS